MMRPKPFSSPQRQSKIGVLLVFFLTLYKLLRGFWAVAAYFIFTEPSAETLSYLIMGLSLLGILVLAYSFAYYYRFLFHVDYEKEVFVLQKGVFATENTEIPFDKIQQVNTEQSLLQRLVNVHKLVIDTAGGKEKEASIVAISKARANELSEILTQMKEPAEIEGTTDSKEFSAGSEKIVWSYAMNFGTLLKMGISSNYFRGLALMAAFFGSIYQEIGRWSEETVDEYMNGIPDPSGSVSGIFILIVLLFAASILISMVEVFIKYFNLKVQQTKQYLRVEMGLKTNKKISFQPRRVQLLQIRTNPVQKKLNLHQVRISLANTENALGKSKLKIPGLAEKIVEHVAGFLFGMETDQIRQTFRPHIILFHKRWLLSLIPMGIALIIWFFVEYLSFDFLLIIAAIYMLLTGIYHWLAFKSLQLGFSENFLHKKYGVWNKTKEKMETYKLQGITITEPIFYKKRNLVNLVFHTAGGDISFSAVEKSVLESINHCLYKIESGRGAWM